MEITLQNSKTLHLYRAKALELFYHQGYYNTDLTDLCENLSLSEQAFEESFTSKEEFFIGISQNLILQRVLNLLIEPVAYKQNPFPLILDRLQQELEEAVENELDNGFVLGNFIAEFNRRNPKINKYLKDILKIWEINLTSLLRKGQLDGYLRREVDCMAVANYIIASYMGTRTLMVEGNSRLLGDQYLQQLRHYFQSLSNSFG